MDLSIFLAKFWGLYLTITCAAMFFNRKFILEHVDHFANLYFIIFSGFVSLLIGILSVLIHNVWVFDWRVLVTIIGWLALLKGIVRVLFPEFVMKKADYFKNKKWLILPVVLFFFVGLYLIYIGFF